MYYIIVDTINPKIYYKGMVNFQTKEYVGYTYNKDEALKISNKDEAERIANSVNGKIKEIKK